MQDLYLATAEATTSPASERINKHQRFEIEKRAVTTATLGGIIPPRTCRPVREGVPQRPRLRRPGNNSGDAAGCRHVVIVPRLTTSTGLAAGSQATENTAVTTQDPTETDLT
jgi:hypothetical protein